MACTNGGNHQFDYVDRICRRCGKTEAAIKLEPQEEAERERRAAVANAIAEAIRREQVDAISAPEVMKFAAAIDKLSPAGKAEVFRFIKHCSLWGIHRIYNADTGRFLERVQQVLASEADVEFETLT